MAATVQGYSDGWFTMFERPTLSMIERDLFDPHPLKGTRYAHEERLFIIKMHTGIGNGHITVAVNFLGFLWLDSARHDSILVEGRIRAVPYCDNFRTPEHWHFLAILQTKSKEREEYFRFNTGRLIDSPEFTDELIAKIWSLAGVK